MRSTTPSKLITGSARKSVDGSNLHKNYKISATEPYLTAGLNKKMIEEAKKPAKTHHTFQKRI